MARGPVNGWDRRRLRLALLAFLVAVAVPTGVLVVHGYGQLKWEAFHQHQALADELVARIDRRLAAAVSAEQARPFADYAFLSAAGDSAGKLLQRSPLAAWPVPSTVPGLVGHFQVDADGRLSSPLLPADPGVVGVAAPELAARRERVAQMGRVLAENRLVAPERVAAPLATAPAEQAAGLVGGSASFSLGLSSSGLADTAAGAAMPAPEQRAREEVARAPRRVGIAGDAAPSPEPAPAAPAAAEESLDTMPGAQAAFDRLNSAFARQRQDRAAGIGRVEDLKLAEVYAERDVAQQKAEAESLGVTVTRAGLDEELAAPVAPVPPPAAAPAAAAITTFENELDAFEFSLLDSGHMVLFRKVWRDGERYIQGLLLDQDAFLAEAVEQPFRATTLALTSSLAVAWRGDVLGAWRGQAERGYLASAEDMEGALLRRARLSAPLSELELVLSVRRLPTGPGAAVLGWSAGMLALVLAAGVLLMYRAGSRQIDLAQQQQDFVAAVSHELKTPLTSIRMYGEMLREGWVADEQRRRGYYDYIVDESERLSRLIGNVLQLARMTRGGLEANVAAVTVERLAAQVREKVAAQVERAGFELVLAVEEGVSERRVSVDEDFVSQVVINLVDNALKFSRHAERRVVEIGFRAGHGDAVVLSVRDHGPGVPRRQMKRIFRLFYRVGSELTRETAGTGIGLALVRELARAMGATVDVVNREPGAEFRVALRGAPGA